MIKTFFSKLYLFFLFFTIIYSSKIFALEDDTVNLLRKDFAKADIARKLQIIQSISEKEKAETALIYKDALEYVQNSYKILNNDKELLEIGKIAVTKLSGFKEKAPSSDIRYLFSAIEDEEFQIACLKTLSVLIDKDSNFTQYLNSLYEEGFADLIAGKKFNINLLEAYAETLKNFAEPSSFEILFKTLLYPVNENLKNTVKTALTNIPFNYYNEIVAKTNQRDVQYIYTLYLLAKENKHIEKKDLGRISEAVIKYGLDNLVFLPQESENLITETLDVLSYLNWSNASESVNAYFFYAQKNRKKEGGINALIPVIDCMGNLGTAECSQNLSIFLGVLNSETEKTKEYNERLMLVIIKALGKLGDKTAFDYLLNIGYLNYSDEIKRASQTAIGELKW